MTETSSASITKKKILIVDDDEAMVKAMMRYLRLDGRFEIDFAYDGIQAGEKFIQLQPDLVILDLRMPRINGYQLCKAIKNDQLAKDVKVLVVSGVIDYEHPDNLAKLQADGILAKPFDNQQLKRKIDDLLKPSGPPVG
ncbi:MAG: response regulator [Candidatus Omnitrophica bacterium]|nr:response regulator [Candidatus Omnitrophota bacterium]